MTSNSIKLSFVVTNYFGFSHCKTLIESIKNITNYDQNDKIIIVDNSCDISESKKLAELKSSNIIVLESKKNVGYFSGLNLGLDYLNKQKIDYDLVIIGNNDLLFPKELKTQIINCDCYFETYPVISPNITTVDGQKQNPHVIKGPSLFRELLYEIYYSSFLLSKFMLKFSSILKFTKRKDTSHHLAAMEIKQGHGSCYFLSKTFFSHYNKLSAPTFLMFEEFFLSLQVQLAGYNILFLPDIHVTHNEHSTIGKVPKKKMWEFSKLSFTKYRQYKKLFY